ncbi:MAG: hypothetical protein HeimC3_10750 [Candidatus Heimdallarchaeota archaeon LC_3]|nr:MAG: hypothetical protein HeimC3_10750 [Candidatus Heimdallarchaeota archaeon LC_3]
MSKINRRKALCKHDWPKIQKLLENDLFQEVIDEIDNIDTLTDLWYILDAYLGLGKIKKAEELLNFWKYRISNPMSDSYWIFYEALIKMKKNQLGKAKIDLKKAIEIAIKEKDEKLRKRIQLFLKDLN